MRCAIMFLWWRFNVRTILQIHVEVRSLFRTVRKQCNNGSGHNCSEQNSMQHCICYFTRRFIDLYTDTHHHITGMTERLIYCRQISHILTRWWPDELYIYTDLPDVGIGI